MRTVRRLYLYAVAFVSLETVLWGSINLARTALDTQRVGGSVNQLASALALLLVGLPVFLLHWWLAQKGAQTDDEERSASLRAVFLYGALLALLIPVVHNTLAIIDRGLLQVFDLGSRLPRFGDGQTLVDNLIAIGLNGLLAAYFFRVLRGDWQTEMYKANFRLVRRAFRYLWVVYGLGLIVFGVQQSLNYVFLLLGKVNVQGSSLADGIALIVVGAPVWAVSWREVQRSLGEVVEKRSLFRLVVLFSLAIIGLLGALIPIGQVLYVAFRGVLGETLAWAKAVSELSGSLSIGVPLTVVWVYYGRMLKTEMGETSETQESRSWRAGIRWTYFYLLALFGLGAVFFGAESIMRFTINAVLGGTGLNLEATRNQLAGALATLGVGLPLWLQTWVPLVKAAAAEGAPGEHARRTVVRKVYLYLALFVGVVGLMFSTGAFFFQIFRIVLGNPPDQPALVITQLVKTLLLFGALLGYHWVILQRDGRQAERYLAKLHARYPVLILDPGDGSFASGLVPVLQNRAPAVPVAVHAAPQGIPDESLAEARAVILPSDLAVEPPEAIRLWLQTFPGERLILPVSTDRWWWLDTAGHPLPELSQQVARMVLQLAEGEKPGVSGKTSPWVVWLSIGGGILGFLVLFTIVGNVLFGF